MKSIAYFAAGCFWGVENKFMKLPGVTKTEVGYMGGTKENPTYEDVLTHTTGHTETVKIEFDPQKISYTDLLNKFWEIHDPTQVDRQPASTRGNSSTRDGGPDIGNNYRSAIFYVDSDQEKIARESKERLEQSKKFSNSIITEISPAKTFWKAEEYHQHYIQKSGQLSCDV